ncbi:MAG: phospholipase D-like domain-containing protein [Zestosphaera sp.]
MNKILAVAFLMLIAGALVGYAISISRPPVYRTVTATLPTTITTTKAVTAAPVVPPTITYTATYTVTKPITVTAVANVDLLTDKDYYHTLLNVLSKANKSIYVIMYAMKYDPNEPGDPVNILLSRVVDACRRGLDVRVLVDDVTYTSYRETMDYLKSNGVPVRLDKSSSVTTHAKVVVVDDQYVFVGSHNWTESALSYNHEVTALIESDTIARQVKNYFSILWGEGRTI